jgi:hypothetical protein
VNQANIASPRATFRRRHNSLTAPITTSTTADGSGIEGAMAISGIPQAEWSSARKQLQALEALGLVQRAVVDGNLRTYRATDEGRNAVK